MTPACRTNSPGKPHLHGTKSPLLLFVVPLAAAAAGWLLTALFVADDSREALIAVPLWLAVAAASWWLLRRLQGRTREQQLAESRLAGIEEAASNAILRLDADGVIAGWSAGAGALYGYPSGEIVGRPFADLLADGDTAERVVEAIRSGERLDELLDQRRHDGDVFFAAVTVIPNTELGEAIVVARDVGELRRLTDELRTADAAYRSLREHLPLVTYVRSLTGAHETNYVSPQIDRLVGYTADEWLSDRGLFARVLHPDDRDEALEAHKAIDPASGLRTTYRLIARDGRTVWVRDEAVVVLDESGRPVSIQGYLQNVSERKTAEDERRELRAAEAATAAHAQDRQRKVDFVAEVATVLSSSLDVRSTVGQVARLVTRDLADWCVVDVIKEDGTVSRFAAERSESERASAEPAPVPERGIVDVISAREAELSDSHISIPLVSRGRRAVGALTLTAGEGDAPYVADDLSWARAVGGMIALALDNSRLLAEVDARSDADTVLTHVDEGVFLLDRDGVVRLWNPAAAKIAGVSTDTAVGKPASDAITDWFEISDRIPVGTTREPVSASAFPLETERGERWISISGVEFFGGTVYAFRDITEEHRLDELKAEFIATASHELRTPLAAVYGAAQTLKRHDFALDEIGRERFISLIVDESDRLAAIVNQILLANQLEVGRVDLHTEPFDAADLLDRVVESARTHAPSHIRFDIRAPDDVPSVAADKDRARQVLVNLVENAVKYSPGGGRIELRLEALDGRVQFSVADEGMGIPADERGRIFEKFYRLDPNMTYGIGGTGLGLYICSELVERMGGRIWLESEEGQGSTFFFELPSTTGRPPVLARAARELADIEGTS